VPEATPGDIFAALFAAHQVGDYWVQTDRQARDKGLPGWRGRLACGRHAAAMAATKAAALGLLHASGRRVSWRPAAVALAADAVSHYWADRRTTLAGLAKLIPGKGGYYADGGAPYLDQGAAGRRRDPPGEQAVAAVRAARVSWSAPRRLHRGSPGDTCCPVPARGPLHPA